MWVLSAWSLVEDQITLAPFGGVLGINWASAREPLKSAGFWDENRDCIPEDLVDGLRVMVVEFAAWKLCDECRDAAKKPKHCSKCGNVIVEHSHQTKYASAEDQLRADLEAEGAYEE